MVKLQFQVQGDTPSSQAPYPSSSFSLPQGLACYLFIYLFAFGEYVDLVTGLF